MTLVHEKEYKALSNMPVERVVTRTDDGFVESHFEESLKMSTYLLAFIVCDFAYKESHLKSGKKVCKSGCLQAFLFAQYYTTIISWVIVLLGTLSKPRQQRQRERHQTKVLMNKTMAVHVHYKSLYIS